MPALTQRPVPLGAVTTFHVVAFVERALDALRAWRNARVTAAALRELSDHQLADVGLARGDIVTVAAALARR